MKDFVLLQVRERLRIDSSDSHCNSVACQLCEFDLLLTILCLGPQMKGELYRVSWKCAMSINEQTNACVHPRTQARTHAHLCTHTQCTHSCTHVHEAHTSTHTLTCVQHTITRHVHTYAHMHTSRTCARACAQARAHTCTQAHTLTHAHTSEETLAHSAHLRVSKIFFIISSPVNGDNDVHFLGSL